MLFDLKSGKRRRVIQVIFGFLAFIFFISFVGFGIGSDVSGGIFDAIGIGNDGSSSSQYEDQIEDAEETLETNPDDEQAMLDLVRYNFLAATEEGIETNPQTGAVEISEESRARLEATVAAWDDYLATDPRKPDTGAASNAAQAYQFLGDADGAAQAQRIIAEESKSAAQYAQLAQFLYADGKLKEGDEAGQQAVRFADASQREQFRKNMDNLAEVARDYLKRLEKAQKKGGSEDQAAAGLENPFGGLSGGSGAPAPAP
jgi:tetratricopeptide (TPR) repeat protein